MFCLLTLMYPSQILLISDGLVHVHTSLVLGICMFGCLPVWGKQVWTILV